MVWRQLHETVPEVEYRLVNRIHNEALDTSKEFEKVTNRSKRAGDNLPLLRDGYAGLTKSLLHSTDSDKSNRLRNSIGHKKVRSLNTSASNSLIFKDSKADLANANDSLVIKRDKSLALLHNRAKAEWNL